jgi:hypothetical protein
VGSTSRPTLTGGDLLVKRSLFADGLEKLG